SPASRSTAAPAIATAITVRPAGCLRQARIPATSAAAPAIAASAIRCSAVKTSISTRSPRLGPARVLCAVLRAEAALAHQVLDVHLVRLVVEAEGVHDEVDAEAERHLALALAARLAGERVVAEVVARPGAAEIVLHVGDRHAAVAQDALHDRAHRHAADRSLEPVERAVDHVVLGDQLEAGGRRRVEGLDELAHRAVEGAAGRPLGRVDEEEAAEG